MRLLISLLLSLSLVSAQAFELRMPAQQWVVLQSHRAKTIEDLIIGVTLPEAKQEELLGLARKHGVLTSPVPKLIATGSQFEILSSDGKSKVTIQLAKAQGGEFVINGKSVLLSREMGFDKMLKLVMRALEAEQALFSVFPQAQAMGIVFAGVAGAVTVILAGCLYHVGRSMGGDGDSDAIDIAWAIEKGNRSAKIRDFKCSGGRLAHWEVSRAEGGAWIDDRVEIVYSGSDAIVQHMTEEFDCLLEWSKGMGLRAKGDLNITMNEQTKCNGFHDSAKNLENISVFANYIGLGKLNKCCAKKSCEDSLTVHVIPNMSERAKATTATGESK